MNAVDLGIDQIEADLADVPPEIFAARTTGDGPMRRLVASVPRLVAEVRRLREDRERWVEKWDAAWADAQQLRGERDAARAEAERLWTDRDRRIAEKREMQADAGRVREALQAIRDLHRECTTGNCGCGGRRSGWCHGCGEGWPCSTVRALDAALDGAE